MINVTIIRAVRLREARVVRDTLEARIAHLPEEGSLLDLSREDREAMAAYLNSQEVVIDLELQLAGA